MKVKLMITALLAAAGITQANVINWPSSYNPLYNTDGTYYADIPKDTGNSGHEYLDIVGDSTFAASYLLYREASGLPGEDTEDQIFFRIRLDDIKTGGAKMGGAYQVFFETDGDDSVNYVLQLSGDLNDPSGTLAFGLAAGTNRNGVTFGTTLWQSTTFSDYVKWTEQVTGDGSNLDGNPDYFLDLAMPWATFSANTGITSTNDAFRLFISSSQSGGQISDGDVANSAATADVNFSELYTETIPEPAVVMLILSFGGALLAGRRIFAK